MLSEFWEWCIKHQAEAFWGLFWAVVVWVIADPWGPDSRLRILYRHFKNKRAERSVDKLRQRVKQLERLRDRADYMASDKNMYLMTLRGILQVLLSLCACGIVLLFGVLFPMFLIVSRLLTIVLLLNILRDGRRDWKYTFVEDMPKRLPRMVEQIDEEIMDLQRKLSERTAAQ